MNYSASVKAMWECYLHSLNESLAATERTFSACYFSDNKQDADELALLVKTGRKRATTSALWAYKNDEPIPAAGEFSIVTNFAGAAQCIIRTTKVDIVPFDEVNEEHARLEGDRSLEHWRKVHWAIFSRELTALGKRSRKQTCRSSASSLKWYMARTRPNRKQQPVQLDYFISKTV